MLKINDFKNNFFKLTQNWDWKVQGFLDSKGYVHPIETDTKVISTVFERLASPVIRSICKKFKYEVEIANQTTYPDYTLTLSQKPLHRIAIDIKTTYLSKSMVLTLGGYNSFLRNNTKNILYPYTTYNEHWILGFIYKRLSTFEEYDLSNLPKPNEINCPYEIKTVFVRKKYEITGLRAGSGNTKNIGSVKLNNPDDFCTLNGPFTNFKKGKEACDYYWKNYEKFVNQIIILKDLLNNENFKKFI